MESYSIDEVGALYKRFDKIYLDEIKPFIEKVFPRNQYSEPVYYILDNFILRRFRAALPYLMAQYLGVPIKKIMPVSASSELMFTIALVQDDFFDRCDKRGDIDASHVKFGPLISMASSDYSYSFATKILTHIRNENIRKDVVEKVEDAFTDIQKIVFESFLMELFNEKNFDFDVGDVLKLHKYKTIHGINAIYSAALICDDHNNTSNAEKIRNYCINLAIAGQIKNDIYDMTKYARIRGFSDIVNGYMTYPLAKLKIILNDEENIKLNKLFINGQVKDIINLMNEKNIIKSCIQDNKMYVDKALESIRNVFDGELKKIFEIWAFGNIVNSDQVLLGR
jgi:geranylgeranyl pyrophosphate synthase